MSLHVSNKAQGISPSPTLAIDAKFKAMKAEGIDAVGFGAGEPDFDTPQNIKEAAVRAIQSGVTKYTPASGTPALKKAICEKLLRDNGLAYTPEQIVVSNGAKHSLVNTFMAILNPFEEVLLPAPYWVSYPEMIRLADGVPVVIPTDEAHGFKFTVEQLEAAYTPRTRALVLNSPSNPTGMLYTKEELSAIADWCVKRDVYVVSDEIYEKLIYEGEHVSIASFGEEIKERTIVVNGVSKSYAMTGWRIGYTASNLKVAKAMANIQSHAASNPNSIAQAATVEALTGPQDSVAMMREAFRERRDYMVERMNSIEGVSCIKPSGAFYVMMNIKSLIGKTFYGQKVENTDQFCELLLEKQRLALVPGTGFDAEGFVRWSYATSMENIKEGLDRLEKFLAEE